MNLGKHAITAITFKGDKVIFSFGHNSTIEFTPPTEAIQEIELTSSDVKEYVHIRGTGEFTAHVHHQTYNSIAAFFAEANELTE